MKTTLDYLSLLTEKHPRLTSDNKLAIYLGVTRQAISQYRKGQSMSVAVALKVAKALDIDPTEPVISTLYAQAGTDEERSFWRCLLSRYEIPSGNAPCASPSQGPPSTPDQLETSEAPE